MITASVVWFLESNSLLYPYLSVLQAPYYGTLDHWVRLEIVIHETFIKHQQGSLTGKEPITASMKWARDPSFNVYLDATIFDQIWKEHGCSSTTHYIVSDPFSIKVIRSVNCWTNDTKFPIRSKVTQNMDLRASIWNHILRVLIPGTFPTSHVYHIICLLARLVFVSRVVRSVHKNTTAVAL